MSALTVPLVIALFTRGAPDSAFTVPLVIELFTAVLPAPVWSAIESQP